MIPNGSYFLNDSIIRVLPASHSPSLLLSLLYSLLLPILPSFLLQTAGRGAFLQPGRTEQGVGRDELLMGGRCGSRGGDFGS